ncbi:unnamed protein product, partial [Medioppia subpectinata]
MTSRRTEFECRHTGCGQTYDRVSHLRRHQISHMTDRPFRCEYESCDAVFDYKYLLGQHMAKLHGNPAAEAVRRRRLENQRCFDPTTGVYVCPHTDCAKEYDTYEKFTHHLRVVHPSVRYPCGHQGCHKSFKTRMQLRRHQWTHSDHKPHRCQHPGCAYATSHKDNLRHHSVIHLAERPVYRCEERDCQKSYNTPAGLRQHVNNEHRSTDMARRHRCSHPNCDRSYVTRQRLKSHMASHSAEPTLRCGRCQELFHTEWYLTKHVNTVHLNKPMVQGFKPIYPCEWPGCDYKGTRTALRNHRNLHTGDKPFTCDWPECDKRFRLAATLRDHKNIHYNLRPYACHWPGCQYSCSNSGNLAKHVKQSHPNVLNTVFSSFRYSSLLDRHVTKIHGNSAAEAVRQQKLDDQQYLDPIAGGYVCPHADCGGKSYDTHRKFRQHTRHVHSCEQFPCGHDGCHKTFKTLKQVDDHRLTHNTVRAYHCPQPGCSYATHVKRYLRHHAVTHLADRPVYRCEEAECQRTFGSQLGLKNHVTREHRSPTDTTASTTRHTCPHPGCDKSYFTSTHLRNHMATHCSEPTLPCDQCSELFRSEWYLKKHVITVHQNKPYVKKPKPIHACEWPGCDYRGTRNRLNHHKTIHTGDKPYVCDWPECGKRFRVITNLREHKNVHSNLRPYACHWPGCSYRCSNSGNLAKHLKTIIDDKQKKASLEEIRKSVIDVTDGQQTSRSNGQKKAIRKTPEEDNEDSDETYVDNNRKRLTKKSVTKKTAIAAKKPKSKTIKTKVEAKNQLKNNKIVDCLTEETTASSGADGQQPLTTTSVTSDGRTRTMFVCQHVGCGQTYDRVSHLRRHRVTHVTERPYRCNLDADCDAVFDYKYLLRQHVVRVHTADPEAVDGQRLRQKLENQRCFDPITQQYHCPHTPCDKTFADLSALNRHLRLRHPARQFPCDYDGCDKIYNTAALLKRHHMAAHDVVKRYACQHPGCAYQTAYRSGLRIHEDTHRTTDRPLYRCEAAADCDRAFKTALSLRYHLQK